MAYPVLVGTPRAEVEMDTIWLSELMRGLSILFAFVAIGLSKAGVALFLLRIVGILWYVCQHHTGVSIQAGTSIQGVLIHQKNTGRGSFCGSPSSLFCC